MRTGWVKRGIVTQAAAVAALLLLPVVTLCWEWPDSYWWESVDLRKGYDVGDPIDANCGAYTFSLPLLDLGGPMSLGYRLDYRTNGLNDVYLTGVDGPFGSNHNLWVERLKLPDRSVTLLRFFLGGGELPAFTQDSDHPGTWVLDAASPVRYSLVETGGTYNAGSFYLLDPIREVLYIFEKMPISGWCSNAESCTSRLAAVVDRNGNALTYAYEGLAPLQPTSVHDGLGRSLTWTYDGASSPSRLLRVTDQAGRFLAFTPEAHAPDCPTWNNRFQPVLRSVADAGGHVTTFRYACSEGSLQLVGAVQKPAGNTPYTQTYGKLELNGVPWRFRTEGQTDAYGHETGLSYDPSINRVTESRPDGSAVEYRHHHNNGTPMQLTDASVKTATFGQSANEQVNRVTDRLGDSTGVTYHPETGNMASLTDAEGRTTTWTYAPRQQTFINPLSREEVVFTCYGLSGVQYADGSSESYARDARGNVLSRTDRAGQTTSYTYDSRGQVLTETNPAGGVAAYTYNADGTLATSTDGDLGVTTWGYDAYKRLSCLTYPGGACVQIAYDLRDRLTSVTDENGHRTDFTYDANGNLVGVTDPDGGETTTEYDLMDRPVRTADRTGGSDTRAYDEMGRLSRLTDATSVRAEFGYDPRGWLRAWTRSGKTWSMAHDDEGVPASATTPLGFTSAQTTDRLGFPVSITDPLGGSTTLGRDALNRVTSVTDPLGLTTRFTYDAGGRLSGVTLPDGGSTTYAYGPLNLPSAITDAGGGAWSLSYTPMGRPSGVTDPLGRATAYGYDARGRLRGVTFPGGATLALTRDGAGNIQRRLFSEGPDLQYGYDAQNRLVSADGVALAYDAEGRVTATTSGGRTFGATYDASGRLATATYDGGTFAVSYTYSVGESGTGLLAGVRDSLTGTQVTFGYDDDGRLRTTALPNGEVITRTWDDAGRLTRLQSGNFVDLSLTYDAAGRITGTEILAPVTPDEHLRSETTSLTYDAASQVASPGFAHDPLGRVTATPRHAFGWDGASRLTGAEGATLAYDGLGQVRTRTGDGATTRFEYNRAIALAPVVAERDGVSGQTLRYYVRTPEGRLLYMIDAEHGNAVRFVHSDQVGSTLALTDSEGELTDAYAYDPYGKLLKHEGDSAQPFTFVGAWGVRQEGAGGDLYQMRARTYDASAGRFLSPEPLWPDLFDPVALNPYAYAGGDPIRFLDPTGLDRNLEEKLAEIRRNMEQVQRDLEQKRRDQEQWEMRRQAERQEAARKDREARAEREAAERDRLNRFWSPEAIEARRELKLASLQHEIKFVEALLLGAWSRLPAEVAERDRLLAVLREIPKKHRARWKEVSDELARAEKRVGIQQELINGGMERLSSVRAEQSALIHGLGGK